MKFSSFGLCDLKRWEAAKRTIGYALASEESEEAFSVIRRIKAASLNVLRQERSLP
jgi:hypothetical protein